MKTFVCWTVLVMFFLPMLFSSYVSGDLKIAEDISGFMPYIYCSPLRTKFQRLLLRKVFNDAFFEIRILWDYNKQLLISFLTTSLFLGLSVNLRSSISEIKLSLSCSAMFDNFYVANQNERLLMERSLEILVMLCLRCSCSYDSPKGVPFWLLSFKESKKLNLENSLLHVSIWYIAYVSSPEFWGKKNIIKLNNL